MPKLNAGRRSPGCCADQAQIADLTSAETQWIAYPAGDRLRTGNRLHRWKRGAAPPSTAWTRLGRHGIAERAQSRPDANTLVNALGIAFGQHLADGLELRWVIATDEFGTDLAVFGEPGDLMMFPANMLAKRLEDEKPPIGQL